MRRYAVVVLAVLTLTAACRKEQQSTALAPPRIQTTTTAEDPADMRGKMVQEVLTFDRSRIVERSAMSKPSYAAGEPVAFTIWLRESPAGLQTHAEWFDAKGKKVHEELRPMKGEKVVTFNLTKKVEPGRYRVVGYWGGNVAAEEEFTVVR
ncbi:MAG TPA: hypothetical protein VF618_02995 [Thermoanaerobaculia bacterium]